VLSEPGRPDIYNQWFDFCFPGTDRFTIWNAYFVTARKAFWEKVHDIARDRVEAMLTPDERKELYKLEFVPARRFKHWEILAYRLVEREEIRFEKFDGLTFYEQLRKLESEIVRNEPPKIHECFELDRSYAYGIGLKIVLDVDVVNRATIESAIDRFIAIGETDWISPDPVPRDRLPFLSEREALEAVKSEVD